MVLDTDFGLLVDYLRGELDDSAAAAVRARLEDDAKLFETFLRLKRTYQVLRSLPHARPAAVDSTGRFAAKVRREFEARDWLSLLPWIEGREEFLRGLRVEFAVRSVARSLPALVPGRSYLEALRAEFQVRQLTGTIPAMEPRPEFVAALRAEFQQRALVNSMPQPAVRDGFRRRLALAIHEAQQPEPLLPAALPRVDADDPFRRRLFRKILLASRRGVSARARRVDLDEYQFSREFRRGLKSSRRPLVITLGVHMFLLALMLVVVAKPFTPVAPSTMISSMGQQAVLPQLPGETPSLDARLEQVDVEKADESGWSTVNETPAVGLDGDLPDPEIRPQPDTELDTDAARERKDFQDVVADDVRRGAPGFFRLRNMSRERKVEYLGSEELYEALDRALMYLQRTQRNDGSWWLVEAMETPESPDHREVQQIEITSVALLAFLGDGHTSTDSPTGYDSSVRRGIEWLLSIQRENGQFGPPELGNVMVHAMATLALAEEFGLTRANHLREPLRRACRWLCSIEASDSAGFPFLVGREASLTTSVWAYMALATARHVRVPPIDLPEQRIRAFMEWFERTATTTTSSLHEDDRLLVRSDLLLNAAAGALNLFASEERAQAGAAFMRRISREHPDLAPGQNADNNDVRYLFFGSLAQALNVQRGGQGATDWNAAFTRTILEHQHPQGYFEPSSDYGSLYGRVYSAAMVALSIENAYRVNTIQSR
jgi:hypothetical protein